MPGRGNAFKAFYVAFGGEPFHLDRYIDTARASKRRVIVVDAERTTEAQLVELCEVISDEPRTIVFDNAQVLKGGKELLAHVEDRDPLDQSLILVAVVRSEKMSALWARVAAVGKRIEYPKIKPWQKQMYIDFVVAEATRNHVTIRKDVCEVLYQCTGPDLYRLANEMKKLAIYVGRGGEITQKLILEISTRTPHAEPYLIAEAVIAKDTRQAMNLFSVLCMRSGEVQYGAVVYQLMKQVEQTVVVKSLQDKGLEPAEIAAMLDINAWRYNESLAPVARKHDLRSLVGYMRALSKLDADVKSSSPFKRTMIEMTMLTISN